MQETTKLWRKAWVLLHQFHVDKEDDIRRKRIHAFHSILSIIKISKFKLIIDDDIEDIKRSVADWMKNEDRDKVWKYTVYHLRNKWIPSTDQRLSVSILSTPCSQCNLLLANHYM